MKKWLIAGVGAAGLLISSVALARVDVGISIGVPGVVYPAPVYAAPAPVYVA
ncbi:virulence factor, partial [Achromobacter xylosoxidans]|nr:virulence factor [Achromobacter xylosoxidans]